MRNFNCYQIKFDIIKIPGFKKIQVSVYYISVGPTTVIVIINNLVEYRKGKGKDKVNERFRYKYVVMSGK